MGAQSCKDSIFGVMAIYIITSHEIWEDVQGFNGTLNDYSLAEHSEITILNCQQDLHV